MAIEVDFESDSASRLRDAGYEIDLRSKKRFSAGFAMESPCVVQGNVHTDLPFSIGAFSAIYGGRIRCISVGRYCSISGDVQTGWDDHPTDWATSSMVGYVPDIHRWSTLTGHPERTTSERFRSMRGVTSIGNDVWIGYGVFLRSGISIGHGAIIASCSVVLSDVPPYCIVGGTPARIIRLRFTSDIITKFLQLNWWDYNILGIQKLTVSNPEAFHDLVSELLQKGKLTKYAPGLAGPEELARTARVAARNV